MSGIKMENKMTINEFRGKYKFLSNFYPSQVTYEGTIYPTVEHAYQASKSLDSNFRGKILLCETPTQAKKLGKLVALREGWNNNRYYIMYKLVYRKFKYNPELAKQLLDTGDAILEEGNKWGDTYWGIDLRTGQGENNLGKILMYVRDRLKYEK